MEYKNYFRTRFENSREREVVWSEIARYLQKYIPNSSAVLDLGSGYCNFINNINAKIKFALDKFINPSDFSNIGVNAILGDFKIADKKIKNDTLDIIFASNFFEHLNEENLEEYISLIQKKLKSGGRLIIIQPNYQLCYKNYFDDYTHLKAWSHTSMCDFLKSHGFSISLCQSKFLPFSMKSKLPKIRFLIRAYLNSPIKPFAKQMLIISQKDKG